MGSVVQPLVSVVIPFYNVREFIPRCLESIIHQSYKNLEVILVDDGSTDDSVSICDSYINADSRIKLVKIQNNSGPATARNEGLRCATGDFIHFMDSDDFIDLNYYESMLTTMLETGADISCSNRCELGTAMPFIKQTMILTSLNDRIIEPAKYALHNVWRYVFKRTLITDNKLLFDESLVANEDLLFSVLALYYAKRIVLVPDVFYHHVERRGSISSCRAKRGTIKSDRSRGWKLLKDFARERGFGHIIHTLKVKGDLVSVYTYKLFSLIPVLRKRTYSRKTKYYLFGILPIMTIRH
ncbi:hypothetical protein RsTz2092_01990 [Deferribacterales bacterium RsTz2092]|nr:hypothetical protein AGMMS49941_02280 [Deferribacterales bacterium]